MFEFTKVKVSVSLEIIEGEDKGFTFESRNKILELTRDITSDFVEPYYLKLALFTPAIEREQRRREVARVERALNKDNEEAGDNEQ